MAKRSLLSEQLSRARARVCVCVGVCMCIYIYVFSRHIKIVVMYLSGDER